MDEPVPFGELLRRHRVAGGLTQEGLAARAGVSARTVSDLERGINQTPRRDTFRLLAEALTLAPEQRTDLERAAGRRPRPPAPIHSDGSVSSGAGEARHGPALPVTVPEPEEAAVGLRIRLLGEFQVQVDARVIADEAWRLRNARRLIAVLALAPRQRLPREQVVDLLWQEADGLAATNNLHQVLHVARRVLEPETPTPTRFLCIRDGLLSLSPHAPAWVDVDAFEAAALTARRTADSAGYTAALDLYGGDLVPDDSYDDLVTARRERLRQEYLRLLYDLARLQEARREHDQAIEVLRRLLATDPCYEEAHLALMRLYVQAGAGRRALQQYETLEAVLRREMDAEPRVESRRLYQQILSGQFPRAGALPRLGPPAAIAGEALSTSGTRGARTHNLPVQLNSFIGRVHDLAEIARLLATSRLLTLSGVGGSGKTRLAVEAATDMLDRFRDGVWLVELAALGQPGLAPQAVAEALGVAEQQGRPLSQTLAAYLAEKHLLLVLDNCEHLIGACAALADLLLRACPSLRILCTSREPLRVAGEVIWPVRSLTWPDPRQLAALEHAAQYEAVQLFRERVQAVSPAFRLTPENLPAVVQICHRLDGLPLAIELAAARASVLTVGQIVVRLDDCFRLLTGGSRTALSRQQTLKATLDWSYDLLTQPEQVLYRHLGVFAGGFTLEAVEAVCAAALACAIDVLDVLAGLVEKSLVVVDGQAAVARYRLLEPVRQYARQALERTGELADASRRHSVWALALAERADARYWTVDQDACLSTLETEYDNLRAALDWCARTPAEGGSGLRLTRALWQFWLWRGHFAEGQGWFERLLAAAPEPTAVRAEVLLRAGGLVARRGAIPSAMTWIEQARSLYGALGDHRGLLQAVHVQGMLLWLALEYRSAQAALEASLDLAGQPEREVDRALLIYFLAATAWGQGDYRRAQDLMEEALAQLRAAGDETRVAISFANLGITAPAGEGLGTLDQVLEETVILFREMSTRTLIGYVLANLGNLARMVGENARAERLLTESLTLFSALHDRAGLAQVLGQLGHLAVTMGQFPRARERLQESLALRTTMGDRRGMIRSLAGMGHLALAEGEMAQARTLFEEGMRRAQDMADIPSMAWLHVDLGNLALQSGDYPQAIAEYQQVATLFERIGHLKRGLSLSRSHLGLVARLQGDRRLASAYFAQSLEVCRDAGDWRHSAALLQLLGELAQELGDAPRAQAHFAERAALLLQHSLETDPAAAQLS